MIKIRQLLPVTIVLLCQGLEAKIDGIEPNKGCHPNWRDESLQLRRSLIAVRMRWLGQEDRVEQLKFEAKNYAPQGILHYVAGNGCVAIFDAVNQKITTHITKEKQVVMTYEYFDEFLKSKSFQEDALVQYNQGKNLK
jgi:hypothetical protein